MRYFITFTFSLLLLTSTLAAQETGTLYLKKVNGKIGWFESGDAQKHLKYTGEIVDGKPNGTGELSSSSEKSSGEFKNGLMHGQVTHTYKSGKKRIGEFRKGKPWNVKSFDKNGNIENEWVNGKKLKRTPNDLTLVEPQKETGILYLKKVNGKIGWFESGDAQKHFKYTGEIFDGKPNGQGTYTSPGGRMYVGEWKDGKQNGQGTGTFPDGRMYVGEWKNGKQNGQGTYISPDGRKYIGEFKDGKLNGQGTSISPDGRKYVGKWKNGKQNGQGTETWSDGRKYVGEHKDGKFHGQGTLSSLDGINYVGEFKNGKYDGTGELSSSSEKYSGEFKNGKMHGQVTHTYKSGKKRIGEFRNGKPWNVKSFDKNGFIEIKWVNGKILKFETETHSFRLRLLYGTLSVFKEEATLGTAKGTDTSIALIWNGWGLGHTNDNYLDKNKSGNTLDFQTQFTELSYTFDLSEIIFDSLTMTLGAGMPSGEAKFTSSTNTEYKSSTVSGYTLFTVFGIELSYFEILAGFRLNSIKYSEFESSSASTFHGNQTVGGGIPTVGLGLSF
jgi:hypothetical protein